MTEKTVFNIGKNLFQIDFEGSQIRFYEIAEKGHRLIGMASFRLQGNRAMFDGSISHDSGTVAKTLTAKSFEIFHVKHPDTRVYGHGIWIKPNNAPMPIEFGKITRPVSRRKHMQQHLRRV